VVTSADAFGEQNGRGLAGRRHDDRHFHPHRTDICVTRGLAARILHPLWFTSPADPTGHTAARCHPEATTERLRRALRHISDRAPNPHRTPRE
jgi:hypothetical protein